MPYSVSGITRDADGAPLGGVTVKLFDSATDVLIDEVVSDGSGAYEIATPTGDAVYAVAYLAGSPDVAGTTRNDIEPDYTPPAERIAGSNLAYAIGDSLTNQVVLTTYHYSYRGWGLPWLRRYLLGQLELPIGNVSGGSGETAATIRSTRLAGALSSNAKVLFLCAGINQGASEAQDLADITYMAETFAASEPDRIVIVSDGIPGGTNAGWDSTKIARHASLRDSIRLLHDPANGIYVAGTWNAMAATTDGAEPASGLVASGDLHPITPGSMAIAAAMVSLMQSVLPAYDPYDAETFVSGTALDGANLAGSTGNAISTASLSGANISSSRMVVDGATTWAELTFNTSSQASLNKSSATLPAEVTPGTTVLSSIILVKLHAGLTNVRGIGLRQIKQSGQDLGTNAGVDGLHPGTDIGVITSGEDIILVLRTPPITVAGDATSTRWQFTVTPVSGQTMTGLISVAFPGMIVE